MTCGPSEWLLILVVLLLVFGPALLPRLTRNAGKYLGSFKKGLRDADPRREIEGVLVRDDDPEPAGEGGTGTPARRAERDRSPER